MPNSRSPHTRKSFRLLALGGASLVDSAGAVVAEQRRRVALLALIAAGRGKGVSRDKLVSYLSPESTSESARHSLHQLLYYVRQQAGEDVLLGTDALRLNPGVISCDAAEFEEAMDRGDYETAAGLYRGPFLDGFHLADSVEFETWAAAERSRLAGRYGDALGRLAAAADARGDHASAVDWWKRLAVLDPVGGRAASGLIRALAASGDVLAALRHAATHEALVRDELGSAIAPELASFVASLRREAKPSSRAGGGAGRARDGRDTAVQQGAPADPGPVTTAAPRSRRATVRLIGGVVVATTLTVLLLGWPRADRSAAPELIAILPFHVASTDATADSLRESLLDLLSIQLEDERGRGTVPARRVLASWRSAGGGSDAELPLATVLAAARELGARWAISGSGVRSGGDLLLSAGLMDVREGRVIARFSARGHPDSIERLVDTLAVRVVALQAGDDPPRGAALPTSSVPAMRAYQAARKALGRHDWQSAVRDYDEALRHDPTFASAALGLRMASGLYNGLRTVAAESIAYLHRDRLTARERENFLAELGPGYPTEWYPAAARLRAWRGLASSDPDNADAWFNLGLVYYHSGNRIDHPNALEEARIALERALHRGTSGEVIARMQLQSIAGVTGDAALLERLFDHTGLAEPLESETTWQRWLRAFTRRDAAGLALVRPALRDAPGEDLGGIWQITQRVGFDVQDAVLATEILAERARTAEAMSGVASTQYHLALNRGRPSEAQVAATRIAPEWRPLSRLAIQALSAMYGDGDSVAGVAAARELASEVRRPLATDAAELRSQMIHVCVSAQWSLLHGDAGPVGAALEKLRTPEPGANAAMRAFYGNCALTLAAWRAVLERRADAHVLVSRLDSLQRVGTPWHWALPEHRVTARLWGALDEPVLALRAIRRRRQETVSYLGADLGAEAELALQAADTAGAMAAWRHYLALRADPEPSMRATVDSVRARLGIIEARRRR